MLFTLRIVDKAGTMEVPNACFLLSTHYITIIESGSFFRFKRMLLSTNDLRSGY